MTDKISSKGMEMHDILAAFSLLTRLPVPVDHARAGVRAAAAIWAYPLVGAFVGAASAGVAVVLLWIGVPSAMAAVAALATSALITGALHEDGIADCADGLGSGKRGGDAIAIMKDSRIGAFGACALMLVLLARWSGTDYLLTPPRSYGAIIGLYAAIGAVSRLPMVLAMVTLPLAQNKGLAASVGRPPLQIWLSAFAIGLALALAFCGTEGAIFLVVSCLAPIPLWMRAKSAIGGYTGDVLGGSQQLAEIGCLCAAAILI